MDLRPEVLEFAEEPFSKIRRSHLPTEHQKAPTPGR
jgi:hypothetical protein